MTGTDDIMQRFADGLAASQGGDRELARATFATIWAEVGDDGDPLHRCAIAHAMADVQDDLDAELAEIQEALVTDRLERIAGFSR